PDFRIKQDGFVDHDPDSGRSFWEKAPELVFEMAIVKTQIPPDLVVKSQPTDIIDIILYPIKRPHGINRACSVRKSRDELLSTAEVSWSTTKSGGVWNNRCDTMAKPPHTGNDMGVLSLMCWLRN